MSYLYSKVDELDQSDLVGSHQCVALIQHYAHVPHTSSWKKGKDVLGDVSIAKGTAIATFVNGKYQNHSHGNHAAFYIGQESGGIWIMDQWKGDPKKPKVSKRFVRTRGKLKNGSYVEPSNNAEAFSVIE
ncbi:BPSL0067 family protein [Paraherbaspirillum soli]|uniref:BPSL0067 family protein n=1 Tax=Paraherbaspirillum soli TaxID=631222 RepID=A0ABW0M4I7_9BURK